MTTEYAHIRESRVWISETDIRVAEALLDALGTAGEPDDESTRLHCGGLRAKLASLGFDSMVTDGGGLAITGWNASGEPVSQGETDTALDVLAQIAPAVAPGCKCVMSFDGCGRGDRDAWLLSFDGVKMNEVDADVDLSLIEYDNELERGLAYEGYIEHALRGHGLAGLVLTPRSSRTSAPPTRSSGWRRR